MRNKLAIVGVVLLSLACFSQETLTHAIGGQHTVGIASNAIPPTVSITSPTGGTVSATITVATTATSPVGIFSVQLLIDSTIFGTVNVPPYNFTWDTTLYTNASHSLVAVATDINGLVASSSTVTVTVSNGGGGSNPFFASLPTRWVSKFITTPSVTITLGTSLNKGPNCHTETYGSCSGSVAYTDNLLALRDAAYNWRDNADQGSQTPHFNDTGWLINVPCQTCVGSPGILNSPSDSFDANSALFTWPAKCSGNAVDPGGPCGINGSGEATQWLTINSTTPNTTSQTVCDHGLPGIGSGTRNPGCANDKPNMWHLQVPNGPSSPAGAGANEDQYAGSDCTATTNGIKGCPPIGTQCGTVSGNGNPLACYVNHVAVLNSEDDVAPGSSQSGFSKTKVIKPVQFASAAWGANTTPSTRNPVAKHVIFEYNYLHGYDPGDPQEPNSLGSPYEDSAGTCTAFAVGTPPGITAWGTVSEVTASGSTLTHYAVPQPPAADKSAFWGPSIYAGETITLGGGASGYPEQQFVINTFDPTSTNTTMTLTTTPPVGQILTVAEDGSGTDYVVGQILNVTGGGGSSGQIKVATLDCSRGVPDCFPTAYTILNQGQNYTSGSGISTSSSGAGSGATVTITAFSASTPIEFSATDSSNHITSVPGFITAGCTPSSGNCASQANYGGTANPVVYTPGCGDDVQAGMNANADFILVAYNKIEKVHWASSESKAISWGFGNGPVSFRNNSSEGGSEAMFSGGSPTDTNGGPSSDNEIGDNWIGHDLNWRFLTGGAGNSPAPPFGCATIDNTASHNTCPFNWAIKNNFELKVGHRNLVYGNIIDGCWADAQTGRCVVTDERICSGGDMCGIYDSNNLPASGTDNVRYEGNWITDGPQPGGMGTRALGPGNGGGLSFPMVSVDYIGNIYSNYGDNVQWANPGNSDGGGIINFAPGGNDYPCTVTVFSGSGSNPIAQANCQPYEGSINGSITKMVRAGCPSSCLVTVSVNNRVDPYL